MLDILVPTSEIPPCETLSVSQGLANDVVAAFLGSGGRKALEKKPSPATTISRVITDGSYALVYRFTFAGVDYAVKEAKSAADRFSYCQNQLIGQATLVSRDCDDFAPYNPFPIANRYLVQRFVDGTPSTDPRVIDQLLKSLAVQGLQIGDPNANAIISPNFPSPIIIDLATIMTIGEPAWSSELPS